VTDDRRPTTDSTRRTNMAQEYQAKILGFVCHW